MELKGILTLATAPRGQVGTGIGGCEHLLADRSLEEDWVGGNDFWGDGVGSAYALIMITVRF